MTTSDKISFIRFLVCANLTTMLVFGLLIITNGNSTSQHDIKPQDNFDTSSTLVRPVHEAAWYSSQKLDIVEENQQSARGGLLAQVWGSLCKSGSNIKALADVCEFKGRTEARALIPEHMLMKKFVECYKEMSSKNERSDEGLQRTMVDNRRLLRGISKIEGEGSSVATSSAVVEAVTKGSIAQDNKIEAAFHIDYSGPKTHPPKNN